MDEENIEYNYYEETPEYLNSLSDEELEFQIGCVNLQPADAIDIEEYISYSMSNPDYNCTLIPFDYLDNQIQVLNEEKERRDNQQIIDEQNKKRKNQILIFALLGISFFVFNNKK